MSVVTDPAFTSAPPARGHRGDLGFGALVAACLLGVLATWAIATPLFAVPDEPAHLYKAYGTAHGEAIGVAVEGWPENIRMFDVPPEMGTPDLRCYFGRPELPAACAVGAEGRPISTAALLPPAWYGIVGGAVRLVGDETSQRAYRMAGAALCAVVIGTAFAIARRSSHRPFVPALLVGLTPMTLFVAGGVNPNGFEIAAFMVVWSLVLVHRPGVEPTPAAGALVGALVGLAILSRVAAVIWVAATAVVLLALLGRHEIRRLATRRFLVPLGSLTASALVGLVVWSRVVGFEARDDAAASDWSRWRVITYTVGALDDITRQMVGVLGWLDTELPLIAHLSIACVVAVLAVGIARSHDRRLVAASITMVVLLAVVPVVVNVLSAPTAGLVWQGRYSLSLGVGLGALGAIGWTRTVERTGPGRQTAVVRTICCTGFAVAEVVAFWAALRRFSVGTDGPWWLTGALPWSPAVAPMPLIAANVAVVLALVAVVLRGTGRDQRRAPAVADAPRRENSFE